MRHDAMLMVRTGLLNRIERLMAQLGTLDLASLSREVDGIRRTARLHDLDSLERLASLLESSIAYSGHRPVALTYLELMRDAALCEARGPDVASAFLAAAALRIGPRPH
jgi:hypothetical protein